MKDSPLLYVIVAALALAVFVADYFTPLGVAVWVLYVVPLALTLFASVPAVPLAGALLATSLMVFTFFTDEPGITPWVANVNRACGIAVIWTIGFLARGLIVSRNSVATEEWLRSVHSKVLQAMQGDRSPREIGERALEALSPELGAVVAAAYASEGATLRLVASQGLRGGDDVPESFAWGEGMTGEVARTGRIAVLRTLPEGFFAVRSGLVSGAPRHLVVCPLLVDGAAMGVLELGLLDEPKPEALVLLERAGPAVAVALRSAVYRARLQELLEETQRQAEELQTQQEELRVTNEELEEQSRALKASQVRLEQQQAELEATNAQLETQAEELEQQKHALVGAKREAERASQYKSQFLANMSHELRTPLNSALILARLLAENREGRLSAEQVRHAETIYAAGNSLLVLINDILDLAKIEAGAMEIRPTDVAPRELAARLRETFAPIAEEKRIELAIEIGAEVPDTIHSDGQRLQQILANLLSNAFKFTERGRVTLAASAPPDAIAFSVRDTGAGIPADKLDVIFEAFRQADDGTHRRYGGTGLGLSISLELAQLLGGTLSVESEEGAGSTFTVVVPRRIESSRRAATRTMPRAAARPAPRRVPSHEGSAGAERRSGNGARGAAGEGALGFADDRASRSRPGRLILVVEDDPAFARILYDLAHELDFDCVVTSSVDEGMSLARELAPSGVLLDLNLPDGSGLTLLDRMKRNPDTRHIPVHVVSVADQAQTALELGAVGYALKPVQRDDIVKAVQKLEARLEQRVRRVLVVEDDEQLRRSTQQLLRLDGVVVEAVGTAQGALQRLSSESFDCVVLDLNLPDASGYSILETMAGSEHFSFPPVIVYTGRDLDPEDEDRLRRYSRSVIVKGARSPERLLDEVTLFLHQVESRLPPDSQRLLREARERDALFEGRSILVVEDDVRNVFALTSIFEPRGARILVARNGREALEQVRAHRPDLVLMDIMMPEMDGLDATRELRRMPEGRDVPVIALTAKAMPDDYESCIAAGASDYMAKPIDVEKLVSLCRVWMPR